MRTASIIILFFSLQSVAQNADTLNGYLYKEGGEEITYFSPLHRFADKAILTRANGQMPISWSAPVYHGKADFATYELLIGHSTGTSSGDRRFDFVLNGASLFTMETFMKKQGSYSLHREFDNGISYNFIQSEYDINGDAFGYLYITVPSVLVREKALFELSGQNQESRDWMMVFMYQRGLKIFPEPTSLVIRTENKCQMNVYVDVPDHGTSDLFVVSRHWNANQSLHRGYNKVSFAAYDPEFKGTDTLLFVLNGRDSTYKSIEINPVKAYEFHIIHHSHNDIGYSHLQTEVELIQNKNIRDAIKWVSTCTSSSEKPIWHIESLWAVENFLKSSTAEEEKAFIDAVNRGYIILSANFANVMSGLCQAEEQNWVVEYAKRLEKKYGFKIQNAMITDVPGITHSALLSYINNDIPYLSLGPNYVESQPDHGDRVGGVIREQGDNIFYWKPDSLSDKKLLVWTAGKGYSYFHNVTTNEKQAGWENRISRYCDELNSKGYPYEVVQLRYSKNADNGPVDSELCTFVGHWNQQFSSPKLVISDVNTLFRQFEMAHGKDIPVLTGEISPYWEDGAYSTAIEEMENREIVIKTMAMEGYAVARGLREKYNDKFYELHRNIVLFHEHTWGSWCSISDPEIAFTTEQWKIKKSFLDSVKVQYASLAKLLSFHFVKPESMALDGVHITNFEVDKVHGGLKSIEVNGRNIVASDMQYGFFELIYSRGINPSNLFGVENVELKNLSGYQGEKNIQVQYTLKNLENIIVRYSLSKKTGILKCHFSFDKVSELDKESLHIAMPFGFESTLLRYGSEENLLTFDRDQLPGSNRDFICAEEKVEVQSGDIKAIIRSPDVNLFEVGSIIDETKLNGAKVWKTSNTNTSVLFLYVLNNYWHTNFKASQDGHFEFEVELGFESVEHKH